jgi:hypothetical protein
MNNKTKQTAVEWQFEQLFNSFESFINKGLTLDEYFSHNLKVREQAKEIEKEQMDKVAEEYWNEGASYMYDGKRKYESFEQYYNETYGGNK